MQLQYLLEKTIATKATTHWAALARLQSAAQGRQLFPTFDICETTSGVPCPLLNPPTTKDIDILGWNICCIEKWLRELVCSASRREGQKSLLLSTTT